MVPRLTRIVTRTGDKGTTGLGDGTRVEKNHPRIEAIGEVDALNSSLGLLLVEAVSEPIRACLLAIQHDLFDLGGELSLPGTSRLSSAKYERLEVHIQFFNEKLSPLQEFILPGGSRAASLCHVARCICRSAERRVVSLSQLEMVSDILLKYLNRLSDLLFVLSRVLNKEQGVTDTLWQPGLNNA